MQILLKNANKATEPMSLTNKKLQKKKQHPKKHVGMANTKLSLFELNLS